MKTFLLCISFCFAFSISACRIPDQSTLPSGLQASENNYKMEIRGVIELDKGWRFLRKPIDGGHKVELSDESWEKITLPHTWNALDGQNGKNDFWYGKAWYRRSIVIPSNLSEKKIFIEFDGANRNTTVYLDGRRIGHHVGGFARFRFDLTEYITPGKPQLLAVQVENYKSYKTTPSTPPYSGDFTFFGGIYRKVRIIATNKLHLDLLHYASPGVFIKQSGHPDNNGRINVISRIKNDSKVEQLFDLRTSVLDGSGRVVAKKVISTRLGSLILKTVDTEITIPNPRLWRGVEDPYLYQVNVEILKDNQLVDHIQQPLGIRSFRIDPDHGFFLNGKYLDLHGVSRHQDFFNKGWAVSENDELGDLDLIQEMGSNTLRTAHYQQSQLIYDECDRRGLVVYTEIPFVDRVVQSEDFYHSAKQQLRELILQNYNHPSIMFWGIGNETTNRTDSPNPLELLTQLQEIAHEEDPSRLTAYASNDGNSDPKQNLTDILGVNRYMGWYYNEATEKAIGHWIDNFHKSFPHISLGFSEYGAGGSIHQHEQNPSQPSPGGAWHPEEYQSLLHEEHWKALSKRPFVWGKYIWNMFDFASDYRSEGDAHGINDKGLVSYDRKVKKDAFFWYKANWTTEPVVHLTSKRHAVRQEAATEIKVYSNCERVGLFFNGISQAEKAGKERIFRWNIELSPGVNSLKAVGHCGEKIITDQTTVNLSYEADQMKR